MSTQTQTQTAALRSPRSLMDADVATVDTFPVLLDATGALWVRNGGIWRYITDSGRLTDWDTRTTLPDECAPYMPLDTPSAATVLRGLVVAS